MRVRFEVTVLLFALALAACAPSPPPRMRVGTQLPEFSLPSLTGQHVESSSLAGKPMVLNFWATWCNPCLAEIPELVELAANDELEVVAVALDQEGEKIVAPFVEKHGMNYTILLGNQEIFERMGGFGIPYTLLLDPSHKVVDIYRGVATRAEIEESLEKIKAAA